MLQEPAIDERLREVRAVVTIAEKAAVFPLQSNDSSKGDFYYDFLAKD